MKAYKDIEALFKKDPTTLNLQVNQIGSELLSGIEKLLAKNKQIAADRKHFSYV